MTRPYPSIKEDFDEIRGRKRYIEESINIIKNNHTDFYNSHGFKILNNNNIYDFYCTPCKSYKRGIHVDNIEWMIVWRNKKSFFTFENKDNYNSIFIDVKLDKDLKGFDMIVIELVFYKYQL